MNNILEELKNAFRRPDNALTQLILINVIVFVVLNLLMVICKIAHFEGVYLIVAAQFEIPPFISELITRPWTILTYAFNHAGFFHILFNMLIMYWFGKLIMEYLGSRKLISLYILGAVAGATLFLLFMNLIPFFIERAGAPMVGASAAVFAIVVAAATLMPDFTFHLIFLGPVRIKYIAGVIVLLSLLRITGNNAGGEIAHLGGALIGYLYVVQLRSGRDMGKPIMSVVDFFKGLFKKRSKIKVSYNSRNTSKEERKNARPSAAAQKNWSKNEQEEIDAILDKISDKGYESLTKEEKQKLFNASKKE